MRGSIRQRGRSGGWEFTIDVGMQRAQRCASCGKRLWVERRPKDSCPKCGGELSEADERCRQAKGGFRTRRECQQAMTKALTAVEDRTFTRPTHVTVREFLRDEWLPGIRSTVRETTYASYESLCEQDIIPRLGSVQLQKLSAVAINALYAYLLDEGRVHGAGGLSASSVRRVHATLHRACRDAVRWGRLAVSPVDAADPPRVSAEHREQSVWTAEQLHAFLESVRDDRLYALWRLLAMTGMRRGEVLGSRWADYDMEEGHVSIHRALVPVNGVAHITEPKTRRGNRTIALDPETLAALKAHAARQADEQREWGEAWTDTGYVFVRENGEPLDPHAVSKSFQDHLRAAALPRIRLHDLRHTYATLALATGINPRIVSGRLGHSTVALTLDIYSHVLPQADQEAAERIAGLLQPVS